MKIYKTRWHLVMVFVFIGIPFIFLLFFSQFFHIQTASLFHNIGVSFLRLFIAYTVSVILAWIWAVSFYKGRRSVIALPIFDVLQSFPTFAALPLAIFFWGPSSFTVIFFLIVTIIWPIFFSIISSLKLVKHDWEEAIEISRIRGFNYVRKFLLPISVTGLITGSIVGLGEGWEALVVTEIVVNTRDGLGNFFQTFAGNSSITIFGILGLLLLIFSVNKLIWLPLLERSHRIMEE